MTDKQRSAQIHKFYGKHLKPLKGATVIGGGASAEEDEFNGMEDWPYLLLQLPNGKRIALVALADQEGNGPGHFDIAPQ